VLTTGQLDYAANDVLHIHDLKKALDAEVDRCELRRVLDLEMSLLPVVVGMEARGFAVNRDGLTRIVVASTEQAKALERELKTLASNDNFNPNSPQQVLASLKALGLAIGNTNKETLAACAHPLAKKVLEYRAVGKRAEQSESLLEAASSDGRIHASFNPLGADTGRFSSSGPNLQNIGRGQIRAYRRSGYAPGCCRLWPN
jgi:DNA polymerase-1